MKMEQTECSETSEYKFQTPGSYPKKAYNIQNTAKAWNQDVTLCSNLWHFPEKERKKEREREGERGVHINSF